jgi:hypothetical protein
MMTFHFGGHLFINPEEVMFTSVFISGALSLPGKYEKPIFGITRNIRQGPGIPF